MVNLSKAECSISSWYPIFVKDSLDTEILPIPEDVLKYLESDPFILPVEVTDNKISHLKWEDGSSVNDDSQDDSEAQPTFPEFSKKIQDVIDDFGAVFIKSNWRTPSDAIWVTATKTLKCTSLEDIYLLLKSSNKIARDITVAKELLDDTKIQSCLVLKKWRDINPSTEFRCFVIKKELVGICQRDVSQYHQYIENEKYNIQTDIISLFRERIKNRFKLDNYSFDVIRYKKDKVKIIDFGLLDESATKGTLFTYSELHNSITNPPEFRFIAEDMGIQPNTSNHFIVPREINEFFSSNDPDSMIDMIRRAVENQQIE
ncbi:cell division cycle protein 123 homolog [Chelonus insularis]|uniref:cell division cycle protein 123 homolog n=1 Tax=Chelonus insularis TaxID=460826 RepID=UPI00158A88B6|nr:cell division cycle protein 123 homolog [Chelonus insularis]